MPIKGSATLPRVWPRMSDVKGGALRVAAGLCRYRDVQVCSDQSHLVVDLAPTPPLRGLRWQHALGIVDGLPACWPAVMRQRYHDHPGSTDSTLRCFCGASTTPHMSTVRALRTQAASPKPRMRVCTSAPLHARAVADTWQALHNRAIGTSLTAKQLTGRHVGD